MDDEGVSMNVGYILYEFDMFTPAAEIRAALEEIRAIKNQTPQIRSQIAYFEKLLKSAEAFEQAEAQPAA